MIQSEFKEVSGPGAPAQHVKMPLWLREQMEAKAAERPIKTKKSAKKDFRYFAFSGLLAGQEGVSFTEDCAPNLMYLSTRLYEEKVYAERQAEKREHLQDLLVDGIPDESLIERLLEGIAHKRCAKKDLFFGH